MKIGWQIFRQPIYLNQNRNESKFEGGAEDLLQLKCA